MTATLPLWPHQEECLAGFEFSWKKGFTRAACVMPTGSGKSRTFAVQAVRHLAVNPNGRVIILVHTDELTDQAYRTVRQVAPDADLGIVKAGQDDVTARIIIASKQTLDQPARRARIEGVSFAIVDECDLALRTNGYGKILAHYGAFDPIPKIQVAGYTATLHRSDDGPLVDIWPTVAYRRSIEWMIEKHYLVDVRGEMVVIDKLELEWVKRKGGDFEKESLAEALSDSMAPEIVAEAYVKHAPDRKGLLFTPTVASAYDFADALNAVGIVAEVVHGELPKKERRAILARLASGETQVICNCAVLTVGFDEPTVSCIVMARPTKSKRLYQQIVGRGLRVDPMLPWEEQDCLILDVVGVSSQHDLRSLVDLTEKQIRPKPDQTLLEALAEEESGEGGGLPEKAKWKGPVAYKEFDPLMRASKRTWNRTKAGTAFLPAGENYILLLPTADPDAPAGSWDVLWANKKTKQQGRTKHVGLPLDMAMQWGEDEADRHGDRVLNTKKQPWRRTPMSDAQREMLARMKITPGEGWRKGDASDALENAFASRRIDPMADMYMKHLRTMGMA